MEYNELRDELINTSVLKTLKNMNTLMIVGWALLIVAIGFFLIFAACLVIGIQLIRRQKLAQGVCIMCLGWLSLGIWPFIVAKKELKITEYKPLYDVTSNEFKKSLCKGYDVAKILLIVGMATAIIYVGLYVLSVGCAFVAIQDFRKDKLAHGACIWCFGPLSLGIWPLVYTLKQRKILNAEVL